MDFNFFYLIILIYLIEFSDANRNLRNRKNNGTDMYKEIDKLLSSWNRIARRICKEERLNEVKNNQIYHCLRDESDLETVSENIFINLLLLSNYFFS